MNPKERLKSLSRREKVIVVFWIVLFVVLAFHSARFPRTELEKNCAEFTRRNGCHLTEEEIREMEVGQRLYNLVEDTNFDGPKEACGCVTYNITDL
ncbi:MAG: hypothetical protein ACLFTQ_02920 [Candidatus Aenigmatarchaeota archaeon]